MRGDDDTTWAGLAYASFLMAQIAVPIVLVILARGKSEYARFHTAQALAVQVVMMAVFMLYIAFFMIIWIWGFTAITGAANGTVPRDEPPAFAHGMMVLFPLHFLMIFGTIAVNFGCGIAGLVQTMRGRDFVVPWIGKWVFRRFFRGRRPTVVETPAL